ncbi:PAS-domain containing protein [Xinfangfangia sp. CPCC 101601]|uniref:histidine kinase n=1 Tax=Pseudogemmobacter lacusdianii TaxID=3069608 RepID=A0ABU0VVB3_9RHOB|nr:PAS domain-containing sensor histidine kinase [Xinfangfangia sp. CPCC 101601]MDQ2065588.1 PAS-domain containing protein [Xinfangfangia sp. CPCC 101601]
MSEALAEALIDPADGPERRVEKLLAIAGALMARVEAVTDESGAAYAQFQRAAMLEDQVRDRTRDLEHALDLLNLSNAKLAEAMAETEAARANLASAIETVQEGFALFDRDDLLILCNARFAMHMTDIRDEIRPGLGFADYVTLVSRSSHLALPQGLTPAQWREQRLLRHQERHVIFNVRMIWDRWIQVSEHRTAEGGTVVLQTDVTDIIRNERVERGRMLDDQAQMIRATLDHLDQGVAVFDASAQLAGWNQRLGFLAMIPLAQLRLGTSFERVLARVQSQMQLTGISAEALAAWAGQGPGRPALTFTLQRPGGLVLTVFAQELPDGGFVMSLTDVTAERAALAALHRANETLEARVSARTLELEDALADAERANASRSRFVAAASHDLLQPLAAAKLYIAAAAAGDGEAALDKAQNALQSVEGILGALLDISKLEAGRLAFSIGPVALGPLLDQLAEEFAPIAGAKGLGLYLRGAEALVLSDPGYLRRIVQNLIANAVRYTDKGRVLIAVRRRGSTLRLEVRDTGPGIPEAAQELIFAEFQRLNARASASEGMGLGLAIVERACRLLGHPLELISAPGRGATFRITLPLEGRAMMKTTTKVS